MITLALDTSTDRGTVALLRGAELLGELQFDRHVDEGLFPALQQLTQHCGTAAFDRLAVGLGPGSFTGIRAGIAAAKGLALPGQAPIHGASSFDALAITALPQMPADCELACVLADARRGEICYRLYQRTGQPLGDHQLGSLEQIVDAVHDPVWFIGAEIDRYRNAIAEIFGGFGVIAPGPLYPSAAAVARLAQPSTLEPIYLRQPQYKKVVG